VVNCVGTVCKVRSTSGLNFLVWHSADSVRFFKVYNTCSPLEDEEELRNRF
jgi:hypothetical protein